MIGYEAVAVRQVLFRRFGLDYFAEESEGYERYRL